MSNYLDYAGHFCDGNPHSSDGNWSSMTSSKLFGYEIYVFLHRCLISDTDVIKLRLGKGRFRYSVVSFHVRVFVFRIIK